MGKLKKIKLLVIRHGQTDYNKKNIYTGWTQSKLNSKGTQECFDVADFLSYYKFKYTKGYSSVLERGYLSYELIAKELYDKGSKIVF